MPTWLVEMDGYQLPLEHVAVVEIRSVIDPIQDEMARALFVMPDDAELSVVFVVSKEEGLSVKLRGDAFTVNLARDMLGEKRRIGVRSS